MFSDLFSLPVVRPRSPGDIWVFGLVCLIAGLGLVACDSNGGPPPSDLEGTYVFTRMEFTVSGVDNFDILADTLQASSDSPRMEFFGGNATVNLIYLLEGSSSGSSLLSGKFSTGNDRVTTDFSNADKNSRFQVLWPTVVQLRRQNNGNRLVANQKVVDVNLRKYSPDRYGGLRQNVDGTLRLELERIQSD